ncbi:helix-turn-helix transcriptional regulator [Escherichia coli]|uniref:helix-turn-helix domain-containing protein n=1 Tax=Escherichia coli TaxID=562 RepID=UPI0003EF1E6D|nr:helix-turn-helix transcriptional regulator [Escherichia coli]EAB7916709.1 XRE family transcriptional regulator [Escherichia coli]EEV6840071.1 XRE family transcriptional regulator [Escherichia coli]EEW2370993.1 XRE family transcriptional regulator [Escherichia coli]EEW3525051.1 XRE family transcriptional regulator [Escherichia coli]EEX0354190.1 XRE family transcriptional regulator [Escherichia coli]
MKEFGIRLKEERIRLGLDQDGFGQLGGVKKNAQSNYENGLRKPDSDYLAGIAAAGVDVLYVLTGNRTPVVTLSSKESVLVENYRSATPEHQSTLDTVSAALAQPGVGKAAKG